MDGMDGSKVKADQGGVGKVGAEYSSGDEAMAESSQDIVGALDTVASLEDVLDREGPCEK